MAALDFGTVDVKETVTDSNPKKNVTMFAWNLLGKVNFFKTEFWV